MLPKTRLYRTLEILPGVAVWLSFILAIGLSFFAPLTAIYFIILFDLYWLFRVIYFIIFLSFAWGKYRNAITTDWISKLKADVPHWREYYHLVIFPTYKEGLDVIRPTLDALLDSTYPADRLIVVLAGEERASEHFAKISSQIKTEYADKFGHFLITVHPDGLHGEIIGKGANSAYAAAQAKKIVDKEKLDVSRVIVSCFDSDTIVHPEYLAATAFAYATHPDPTHSSFQPVVLFNNNIWESPAIMRLAAFGTTFWIMSELARPDRLFTFSSHSMSLKALVDVGYWEKDVVSEDSRIFLQCFFHYKGNYSVTPIYIPVSMDTVMSSNIWKSLKSLYVQQRRWAWGVEHFPYMFVRFAQTPEIGWYIRLKYLFMQCEGMYSWATAPILIFLLGHLPLWVADRSVQTTFLAQSAPYILEQLLTMAMAGIFVSAALSLFLLPPPPKAHRPIRFFVMLAQWALLPVSSIIFSALPAIDAQTRLMLGRYLGFAVTEKVRK